MSILLSGCGGESDFPAAPAGLSYGMTSSVYEVGTEIVANRPSVSGGPVQRYTVAPQLPAGLMLDRGSGIITGTPTAVSPSTVYTVTAENAGGSATARVEIEVRQTPAAPAGLTYRELKQTYTVGQPLSPNAPSSAGGPITSYSVTPALPAGLSMDPSSGVISGTPSASAAPADYVVTGANAAGSTTVTLRLSVQPALLAPASLSYATPAPLYVAGEPITPNTAQVTGGPASTFSVAPALPPGLSINAETGAIAGTPNAVQPQAIYTVTASNAAGSAQAQVKISVTTRGTWTAAAPIPLARHYSAAVKLANGKVLVVGGISGSSYTGSADIYDPATNTWVTAASMLMARADPSATLLADGRVLVTGGDNSLSSNLASAELYDPVANTWTATGSMNVARTRHSVSLLPSGKVLVIGGYEKGGSAPALQTAELYDPGTGTWSLMTTPLAASRAQHGGQLLADGSAVLLVGGISGSHSQLTSAELFPVNDSGSTTPVVGTVPAGNVYTSVRLADGSVLAISDSSTTAVRFDPTTSSWTTSTLASGTARLLPTMTVLADGRVLLAGGAGLGTAEIYNPDVNTWTLAASMATTRSRATTVLLDDGSALVIAGDAGAGSALASVERFAP